MLEYGKLVAHSSPVATGFTSRTPVDPERSEWGRAPSEDRIAKKFCECLAEGTGKVPDAADTALVVPFSGKLGKVNHVCLG